MDIRQRILTAAGRVYSQHGFRGATTRLIAEEADVNEVTLFRTFGSKEALFEELACAQAGAISVPSLTTDPRDPERELTEWCATVLAQLTHQRSVLRKSISDMEDRPRAAEVACRGPQIARGMLTQYLDTLRARGMAECGGDVDTTISMLISSLFADAMCRDMMSHAFPEPAEEAPGRYVRCFLRAVGVQTTPATHAGENAT